MRRCVFMFLYSSLFCGKCSGPLNELHAFFLSFILFIIRSADWNVKGKCEFGLNVDFSLWSHSHMPPWNCELTPRDQTVSTRITYLPVCYHTGDWCLTAVLQWRLLSLFLFFLLGGNLWSYGQREVFTVFGLFQHGGYFWRWVSHTLNREGESSVHLCSGSLFFIFLAVFHWLSVFISH